MIILFKWRKIRRQNFQKSMPLLSMAWVIRHWYTFIKMCLISLKYIYLQINFWRTLFKVLKFIPAEWIINKHEHKHLCISISLGLPLWLFSHSHTFSEHSHCVMWTYNFIPFITRIILHLKPQIQMSYLVTSSLCWTNMNIQSSFGN